MRLIDADVLLDIFKRNSITDKITIDGKTIIQHLNDAPTAKFHLNTVVHARWRYKVAYVSHAHVTNIIWCTACNYGFHRIEGENFNFCPNCGAKMDGDQHDSC